MGIKNKYWSSYDELKTTDSAKEAISNEFTERQGSTQFLADDKLQEANTGRRDFLKFMGFGLAAATLAACETPVVKSIPYVVKPEEVTPGVANFYASTYYDGQDYGNLLVKSREGRPVFIKGNKEFGISKGALNSRMNASVLGLYDSARLKGPRKGSDIDWNALDGEMKAALSAASNIRILSNTVISPSTRRAIQIFSDKYAGKVKHVQYDTISYNGLSAAYGGNIPQYDFSTAKTIVSIGADFLGTWLTPVAFTSQYKETRKPENGWMSKHFQFESNMSLTGSNSDVRCAIRPSQEGAVVAAIYAMLNGGSANVEGADVQIESAVNALNAAKGESIVVAGSNDANVQAVVAAINTLLGNDNKTVNRKSPLRLFAGSDSGMKSLVDEMNAGSVDVLIVYGTNPAYSYSEKEAFATGLEKVKASVCFNLFADETGSRCTYMAPDHHYLEAWNDYEPFAGRIDLAQPIINPLYNTRAAQENFLRWSDNTSSYYDFVRQTHNGSYTAAAMKTDASWNQSVHNGTMSAAPVAAAVVPAVAPAANVETEAAPLAPPPDDALDVQSALGKISSVQSGNWELSLYQKVTMGAGMHANNAMLNETPDPITKVTWDNYVTMAAADMEEMGLQTYIGQCDCASLVTVTVGGKPLTLPAFPTPGQKRKTIGIALGYGRGEGNEEIGKAAYQTEKYGAHIMNGDMRTPIGQNAFKLTSLKDGFVSYNSSDVSIVKADGTYAIATTQMHNTVMGRDSVVKETLLAQYLTEKDAKRGEASYNKMVSLPVHADVNKDGKIDVNDRVSVREFDLWAAHPVEGVGHRWGMTIDLSSCIGCGSCITACHTENNVPVVGKDEVHRHRDMHWMRIDRYFSSEHQSITIADTLKNTKAAEEMGTIGAYREMENPEENPRTVHMPMMCQHCNHAPCETVCPVAATVHSNEGLNNMAYNRCIGTRYCANNCPYKVRRFNWFNYVTNDKFAMVNPSQDETLRMVLNPDVTVRTRGVMEKCSMCQQRIQAGKTEAKRNGNIVTDGMIQSACAEACPTNAIVFGDLNDTKSVNTGRAQNVRSYNALEETGVQPNIFYMTKVRNIETTEA